ncbi:carbon-nitrogen hydrolase family protein [Pseudomonas sp. MWU16-30317]|uniref:carbon-nitrogen hydrolase family protein n=1 Tax=Pseudomonas sp. MWU16-30317 TaxID=2878095 RepID=UPI001CFA6900|nr:carbon-nitrogen hydrolase family protein [Pseudomonas sp. MWU16-30317]
MRLALYQCHPLPLDTEANLQRLEQQASTCAAAGANLLITPEMFLSGYNIGAQAVARLAEAADGRSAQRIAAIARRHGIAILYGYPERATDGQLFNAVQLIDRHGTRLGNYRKTHLFGELDQAMFSPGVAPSALLTLDGWTIGLLICYDLEFPENTRQLAQAGAELILVPTANMLPYEFVAQITVRSRAFENQCVVAYANYAGSEGAIQYCGLSSVAAGDGSVLGAAGTQESVLMADIDRPAFDTARQFNRYLDDLRPETYRLPLSK